MLDNIDALPRVLFYGCGKRILEFLLVWSVAASGSMTGSILVGIIGYFIAWVASPSLNMPLALIMAVVGMLFSIPIGFVCGGVTGTLIAVLLVYLNFWRPMLIACVAAFVIGLVVSGVAVVPIAILSFIFLQT